MREVKIKCLVNFYRIKDLGVALVRNEERILSEDAVASSSDFLRARQSRAIEVTSVERFKQIREAVPVPTRVPPLPPTMAGSRAKHQAEKRPDPLTEAQVKAIVGDAVKDHLGSFKADLIRDIKGLLAEMPRTVAVMSAPSGTVDRPVRRAEVVGGDEDMPIFIPSDLLAGAEAASITVKEEVDASGGGLDDARSALKALRLKRSKSGDTNDR